MRIQLARITPESLTPGWKNEKYLKHATEVINAITYFLFLLPPVRFIPDALNFKSDDSSVFSDSERLQQTEKKFAKYSLKIGSESSLSDLIGLI
jgi:hypothetical protein